MGNIWNDPTQKINWGPTIKWEDMIIKNPATTTYTCPCDNYSNNKSTTTTTTDTSTTYTWSWNNNSSNEPVAPPTITNIKIFNPNKVVGITFSNGKKIKTICDNRDFFSLEYACFLAYAKLLYSKEYTHEGVLNKVEELQTKKEFVKLVKRGINKYKEEERLKLKKEKEEAEKKAIKARKIEKAARKRKKSQEAQIKNIANIIKETLSNE